MFSKPAKQNLTSPHLGKMSAVLLAALLLACGSEQEGGQDNVYLNQSRSASDSGLEEEPTDTSGKETTGDSADAVAKKLPKDSVFIQACAQMQVLELSSAHQEYAARFCANGKPTALLAQTLPARAFAGEGDLRLMKLAEVANDSTTRTTSLMIAGAVSISVTAEHYFKKMTEFMDDREAANALGVKLISSGDVTETTRGTYPAKTFGSGDSVATLIKGWDKSVKIVSTVSDQTVTSEYEYRADHYELIPGKAYLITNGLTTSIQGVKDNVLFALMLQNGDDALLIGQLYTKTDHRGLPTVARTTLITLFKEGLRNVYDNARKIKNSPVK
jgi:hypothetical protein